MAEVVPMSRIRLLYNVPLNSDYENTYYFDSLQQQLSYFLTTFEYREFDYQSYQRKNRGWLRIATPHVNVYNANYLMFRNDIAIDGDHPIVDYETKWYYAFITHVNYINERTCEIHYIIDVIQTYMFDWVLKQCMVERESVYHDRLYEHRIDEGLPIGDYIYTNISDMQFTDFLAVDQRRSLSSTPKVVIAATVNDNYEDTTDGAEITHQWNRVITGCNMLVKELGNAQQTNYALYWLNNLPGEKQGAILGIYILPKCITNQIDGTVTPDGRLQSIIPKPNNTLGSYTPKNKKMLTAPYKALFITSSDGNSRIYDYSKFNPDDVDFNNGYMFVLNMSLSVPLNGYLNPLYYQGEDQKPISNIPLPTIPSCTWSNDTYKAWAALNTGYVVSSIAASAIDAGIRVGNAIGAAGITGNIAQEAGGIVYSAAGEQIAETYGFVGETSQQALSRNIGAAGKSIGKSAGGLVGDIQNVANTLISIHNAKIAPDSFNGSAQNLAAVNAVHYGFYYGSVVIREDYAKIIDDYFTMFGYKVSVIKTPSLKNRDHFTYIKTTNSDIAGTIPSDDKNLINRIFNKGIRFWCSPNDIGNFSVDNLPLGDSE